MSVEDNKTIVRRAFDDIANNGDLAVVDEILAPTFIRHDLGGRPDVVGPEGVKRFIAVLRAAFPDLQTTAEEMIGEGDKVVVRFTARGTHRGELRGIAPTGKQVAWAGINVYKIAGGKIVETWQLADDIGLMRQIGAIPS